jgi:ubiquinone/menaquinone biosynthesis C-methylase UbiE
MIERIYPAPLYTFLDYANDLSIERKILDCGVGGSFPKLTLFSFHMYELYGIEILKERLESAENFCIKYNIKADLILGDIRNLPYDSEMFGFVYSYNTIFHMKKVDVKKSIQEMFRVLKPGGLLYLNLLSIDDLLFGDGEEISPATFRKVENEEILEHTFFEFNEGDKYFSNYQIIYKQIRKEFLNQYEYISGMIDYIVKK